MAAPWDARAGHGRLIYVDGQGLQGRHARIFELEELCIVFRFNFIKGPGK